MSFIGEIAALATAFCWSIAVVFFRQLGSAFHPLTLNLWKGIISITGLAIIVVFINGQIPTQSNLLWLLLSGVIGIGIGDTAFFAALNQMGERSTLLIAETLAPIFTAILAILWISEWLNAYQWMAIAIILFGIDIVLRSKKKKDPNTHFTWSGFSFAAIAALCQAAGAVIGRDVLLNTNVDSLTASLIRLCGGLIFIIPVMLFSKTNWLPNKPTQQTWKHLFVATFIGTFIAMSLQMFSFAHAEAAIVQSLFASCIIFSLLIAWFQGHKISAHALIGSIIATVGISIIFIN
ncbi:DMT family transporter [Aliikangiella sp. IMCC44359]|uniref:DMT family transporter n=1 Tax=Aliikangiella sp. IMCC44359 TaxID=3459125 RepID=UPI00403AD0E9